MKTEEVVAAAARARDVTLARFGVQRTDFDADYGLHVGFALMTAVFCLFVRTRSAPIMVL